MDKWQGHYGIEFPLETGSPGPYSSTRVELLPQPAKPGATRVPAVIASESVFMFDVDKTLLMYEHSGTTAAVEVFDPYEERNIRLYPNKSNIKLLKRRAKRGATIVVWSADGYRWAEQAVKALGLESYVDFIMSKPQAYIDDLQANQILGERMYFEPNDPWGNK